jgi:hypothetical protein
MAQRAGHAAPDPRNRRIDLNDGRPSFLDHEESAAEREQPNHDHGETDALVRQVARTESETEAAGDRVLTHG